MALRLIGSGGAPGIAFGRALRRRATLPTVTQHEPADLALARFRSATAVAAGRLMELAEQQRTAGLSDIAGIFEFQAYMVEEPALIGRVTALVCDQGLPLNQALERAIGHMRATLAELDDPYLSGRAADIDAAGQAITQALDNTLSGIWIEVLTPEQILVADDLTPAEVAALRGRVAGFATLSGGPNGHAAILARSYGIPAVVGLGAAADAIHTGDEVILDGAGALLIVTPDAADRAAYQAVLAGDLEIRERRRLSISTPGRLADGRPIALWANIGSLEEARAALANGAEGIGLFRTEHLFLGRAAPPGEDEQYAIYRAVLEMMAGRPVVVRTLDIGGDKQVAYLDLPREPNPSLGMRGLRFCMIRPDLLHTQLRALLRAAAYGPLRALLPMIATPDDLAWGRAQLRDAATSLAAEGVTHNPSPPLGAMVETPAAALTIDVLAPHVEFFSIGSNDLSQYALAADRGLPELARRYPHDSPAVIRLIAHATNAARDAGVPIGVCGELAGTVDGATTLVGLGIDLLSMTPASIPAIKERLASIRLEEAADLARHAQGYHESTRNEPQ